MIGPATASAVGILFVHLGKMFATVLNLVSGDEQVSLIEVLLGRINFWISV